MRISEENLYQEFKRCMNKWEIGLIDRVRVMPVASTVFIYLITSSTGSTGGLQDIKITCVCVERQECERKLEDDRNSYRRAYLFGNLLILKSEKTMGGK